MASKVTPVGVLLWALTGLLFAIGIASLPSIGLFVLPVAVVLAVITTIFTRGRGVAAVLSGAGAFSLHLAYLHRDGSLLNPVPFLIGGLLAVVVGVGAIALLDVRHRASTP